MGAGPGAGVRPLWAGRRGKRSPAAKGRHVPLVCLVGSLAKKAAWGPRGASCRAPWGAGGERGPGAPVKATGGRGEAASGPSQVTVL